MNEPADNSEALSAEVRRKTLRKMVDARSRILEEQPFYGELLMHLQLGVDRCGTACTDMKHLLFDPDFAEQLSREEMIFVMEHEVLHCALDHCIRAKGKLPMLFNIACDIVVNSNILQSMGLAHFKLAGENVMHLAPDGNEGCLYSAEQVYEMLLKALQSAPNGPGFPGASLPFDGSGDPDDNDASEDSDGTDEDNASEDSDDADEDDASKDSDDADEDDASEDSDDSDKDNASENSDDSDEDDASKDSDDTDKDDASEDSDASDEDDASKDSDDTDKDDASYDSASSQSQSGGAGKKGKGGKGGHGKKKIPLPKPLDSHDLWGTVEETSSLEDEWKQIVKNAAQKGWSYSQIPQSLRDYAELLGYQSKVNWRSALQDFIRLHADRFDYTFAPSDRRYAGSDFVMPAFTEAESLTVEHLWFCVDTSGSISPEILNTVMAEIREAILQFDSIEGALSFFTTYVTEPVPFDDEESFREIRPTGFGGTDFGAIFRYMKEHMSEDLPVAVIVLTDGQCDYPPESDALDVPVLWILVDQDNDAPWGRCIHIDSE